MRKRRTISLDLRERILAAYDEEEGTREQIAQRFLVSVGMVKKLLQQRRHTGDIAPQHHRAGRKPMITPDQQRQLQMLVQQKPALTLRELREIMSLACSLQAIHAVLVKLGLSAKKRRSARANQPGPTLAARAKKDGGSKPPSTPRA